MSQLTRVLLENPGIEEEVVLGQFMPVDKRITSEVANMLDAEELALMTDADVGGALSRVTGLSLVGDKYVYVRGLGERYSSTVLDGSRLSSPVPFQKTVPLDIVPTSIVRNLLVQKTYSPDLPGDFSGGTVMIRTRATPDRNYATLKASAAGHAETTQGPGLSYRGGLADNWGFDEGTRRMPQNIVGMSSDDFESTPWPDSAGLGASFYNFWDVFEKQALKPNFSGSGEMGVAPRFPGFLRRPVDGGPLRQQVEQPRQGLPALRVHRRRRRQHADRRLQAVHHPADHRLGGLPQHRYRVRRRPLDPVGPGGTHPDGRRNPAVPRPVERGRRDRRHAGGELPLAVDREHHPLDPVEGRALRQRRSIRADEHQLARG